MLDRDIKSRYAYIQVSLLELTIRIRAERWKPKANLAMGYADSMVAYIRLLVELNDFRTTRA
jgi:hypothetical protein